MSRSPAGNLVDTTYPRTGGTAPNWTFSSTRRATRVLVDGAAQDGSTPIFQYFPTGPPATAPATPTSTAAGNPYVMLLDGAGTLPSGVTTSAGGAGPGGDDPGELPEPLPMNTGAPPA